MIVIEDAGGKNNKYRVRRRTAHAGVATIIEVLIGLALCVRVCVRCCAAAIDIYSRHAIAFNTAACWSCRKMCVLVR